jgi:TatD DNase family protein
MSGHPFWIDTHCHLDAPEFAGSLDNVIRAAADQNVKAILLPAVKVADCSHVKELAHQYGQEIPGLVYTLGIHR